MVDVDSFTSEEFLYVRDFWYTPLTVNRRITVGSSKGALSQNTPDFVDGQIETTWEGSVFMSFGSVSTDDRW